MNAAAAASPQPPDYLQPDRTRLLTSLNNVFTVPRSFMREDKFRAGAGDYISSKFGMMGLLTGMQMFSPPTFHEMVRYAFCFSFRDFKTHRGHRPLGWRDRLRLSLDLWLII